MDQKRQVTRGARSIVLGNALLIAGLAIGGAAGCQGTVDQEQLSVTGGLGLGPGYSVGQTFTAGCSGQLTGVEVGIMLGDAGYTYPDVVVEVSDSSGVVGTSSLPATAFSAGALPPLYHDSVGSGFFQLNTQGITVAAGQQYAFDLLPNPSMAGTCDADAGICSAGRVGNSCGADYDCNLYFFVDDTGNSDPYAGGFETIAGGERAGFDLAFKTFVGGCPAT